MDARTQDGSASMPGRSARTCQRFLLRSAFRRCSGQWPARRALRMAGALRVNKKFPNHFKLICPVQPRAKKQSASRETQISPRTPAIPARKRGVSRSSRTLGWVAVDAKAPGARQVSQGGFPVSGAGAPDEWRSCVRQRRVVLAPVAGVKLAEICGAQPGFGESSIRQRWRQEEFVSRESAL